MTSRLLKNGINYSSMEFGNNEKLQPSAGASISSIAKCVSYLCHLSLLQLCISKVPAVSPLCFEQGYGGHPELRWYSRSFPHSYTAHESRKGRKAFFPFKASHRSVSRLRAVL
ncbi:MAG: hypothetical protein ICV79_29070 [Flavisolibacter sp.]|nr:hypothetical protein [Flavisolibacter sp.]